MNFRSALMIVILASCTSALCETSHIPAGKFAKRLLFGSEMTVSSDELLQSYPKDGNVVRVTTYLADSLVRQMKNSIQLKYQDVPNGPQITELVQHSNWYRTAYRLSYPDGFKLTFFPDPGSVELNSSPSSLRDLERNLSRIQEDFFDEAEKVGLVPALFTGSGHIHIEVTKAHPATVRNFLADFYNHTGLAAGALNEDVYNAIGAGEIPERNKRAMRDAFAQFDRLESGSVADLQNLLRNAYSIKRTDDLPEYQRSRNKSRSAKYFAVSFDSLEKLGTIEIRSIRPQASAESYLKLVKLFTARMELAEQKRLRGERVAIGELRSLRGKPREILAEFDRYVTEAGLDFRDYTEFVLPWWKLPGADVEQYLATRAASGGSCSRVFQ